MRSPRFIVVLAVVRDGCGRFSRADRRAQNRPFLKKVLDIVDLVCYSTLYMDEYLDSSLSPPFVTPGHACCSGGVGGRFDKTRGPVRKVLMVVFLTYPAPLPAEACPLRPPSAEVAVDLGGSFGEKNRKPLNLVKSSQIEDPSKGHNSLYPCGEKGYNPCFRLIPLKGTFSGRKAHEIARCSTVYGSSLTI